MINKLMIKPKNNRMTHNKSRKEKKIKYTKDELKSLYWDYIKICNYESYSYGGGVGCGGGYKNQKTIEGFIEWLI